MAKIEKYSFHSSGICRSAFTTDYGVPSTMTDRAMFKWRRLATPPPGEGKASRVAWLAFPTDYLSQPACPETPIVNWLEGAPSGGATYVKLAFTAEPTHSIEAAFQQRPEQRLVICAELPTGDGCFVSYYHSDWENEDLTVPGDGQVADLLFSSVDPYKTGRPVRIRFGPPPSDGDAVVLRELGGYPVPGTPNPTAAA